MAKIKESGEKTFHDVLIYVHVYDWGYYEIVVDWGNWDGMQ